LNLGCKTEQTAPFTRVGRRCRDAQTSTKTSWAMFLVVLPSALRPRQSGSFAREVRITERDKAFGLWLFPANDINWQSEFVGIIMLGFS